MPLHRAAAEGHEATARTLIYEGKADVNAKDNDGWTPLHGAIQYAHEANGYLTASPLPGMLGSVAQGTARSFPPTG